jgi:hypothetical protein
MTQETSKTYLEAKQLNNSNRTSIKGIIIVSKPAFWTKCNIVVTKGATLDQHYFTFTILINSDTKGLSCTSIPLEACTAFIYRYKIFYPKLAYLKRFKKPAPFQKEYV